MSDITLKDAHRMVRFHLRNTPCTACINYEVCQKKKLMQGSSKCRELLALTYATNKHEGLVVAVERAKDWNIPPTPWEQAVYEAYMNVVKEAQDAKETTDRTYDDIKVANDRYS